MRDSEEITCLKDIQAEKKKLRIESEVCLAAFSHSTKQLGADAKKIALGKIAIPLGVISAIGVGVKMLKSNRSSSLGTSDKVNYLQMIFSVIFPFIKDFFLNKSNK